LAEVDGQTVCSRLMNGETPNDITADFRNPQLGRPAAITKQQTTYFVIAAVTYYCGSESESFTP
jgi:hypothetical protein